MYLSKQEQQLSHELTGTKLTPDFLWFE